MQWMTREGKPQWHRQRGSESKTFLHALFFLRDLESQPHVHVQGPAPWTSSHKSASHTASLPPKISLDRGQLQSPSHTFSQHNLLCFSMPACEGGARRDQTNVRRRHPLRVARLRWPCVLDAHKALGSIVQLWLVIGHWPTIPEVKGIWLQWMYLVTMKSQDPV